MELNDKPEFSGDEKPEESSTVGIGESAGGTEDLKRTAEDKVKAAETTLENVTHPSHTEKALQESEAAYRVKLEQEVADRLAELKHSRDELRSIYDNTLYGISVLRAVRNEAGEIEDFQLRSVNKQLERETGRTDLVGKLYAKEYPGIKQVGLYELMLQTMETGKPTGKEYYYSHEGFDKWFSCQFVKLEDGLVATNFDITERKNAEEKAKEQAHLIESITDVMPNVVTVVDYPSRNIHYSNRDSLASLGFDADEIARMKYDTRIKLFHPDDVSSIEAFYHRFEFYSDTDENYTEYRLKNNKDEWIWISLRGKVFRRDNKGKVSQVLLLGQDVTERKRSEQEILGLKDQVAQKATDRYLSLFNSIDEGFCVFELQYDANGDAIDWIYTEANPAFEKQTGYINPVGKRISHFQPDLERSWFERFDEVDRTGEPIRFVQYTEAMGIWYDVYALRAGEAGQHQISLLFTDITERKRHEANLAFLAEVSQDLVRLTNIDDTMNAIGEKLGAYFRLSACVFAEQEFKDGVQLSHLNHGWHRADTPSLLGTYRMKEFMTQEMIDMCYAEETIIIRDVFADPKTDGSKFAAINVGSFIGIPLVRDGEWRFLLVAYRSEPYNWREDQVELLRELMNRIWTRLERARAEKALRESEEKYRAIFNSVNEGFSLVDVQFDVEGKPCDLIVLDANPAQSRIDGFRSIIGKSVLQMLPNVEMKWLERYAAVTQTGEPVDFEDWSEANQRWYRVHASRVGEHGSTLVAIVYDDISERKKASEILRESEERKTFLLQLSDVLRTVSNPDEVLQKALNTVGEYLDLDRVVYNEIDPEVTTYTTRINFLKPGFSSVVGTLQMAPFRETVRDLEKGITYIQCDVERDHTMTEAERQACHNIQVQAFVTVPLVKKGQWVCNLVAHYSEPRNWTTHEIAILEEAADRTWVAVEKAKADEALRASEERKAFMLHLSDALRPLGAAAAIEREACRLVGDWLKTDHAFYCELDVANDYGAVRYDHVRNGIAPLVAEYRISNLGFVLPLYQRGRPIVVNDVFTSPVIPDVDRAPTAASHVAWISVPIIKDNILVGSFCVAMIDIRHWTDEETELVAEAAERVWSAIERGRAEEALKKSETKYRTLFQSIDEGFALIELPADIESRPLDFRFLEVNKSFEQQTGNQDVTGKLGSEINPGVDAVWIDTFSEIAATEEPRRLEIYHQTTGRWYDVFATRVGNAENRQVCVIFQNITERRRREADLAFLAGIAEDYANLDSEAEIMQSTSKRLATHLRLEGISIADVDDVRNSVTIKHHWNFSGFPSVTETHPTAYYMTESFSRHMRAGETWVARDVRSDDRIDAKAILAFGIAAYVSVPYILRGEWKGVFTVTSSEPRDWTASEIALIEEVSNRTFPRLERASTEQALRESEERFRSLATATSDTVYKMSADWTMMHELEGKSFLRTTTNTNNAWVEAYIPEQEKGRVSEAITSAIENKAIFELEHQVFNLAGDIAWTYSRAVPKLNEEGEIIEWIGVASDITFRKNAEQELRESEHRLQGMVNIPYVGVLTFNFEGEILSANDAFLKMVGYSRQEFEAEKFTWQVFTPAEHVEGSEKVMQQLKDTGTGGPYTKEYYRKDGSKVWLLFVAADLGDNTIVEYAIDVSDQKKAEEALRLSEERLQLATAAGKTGTFIYYPQEDRSELDEQALDLFGLSPHSILNLSEAMAHIIHVDDRERHMKDVLEATNPAGDGKLDTDFRVIHPDGSLHWLHVIAQAYFEGSPPYPTKMPGVAIDITRQKIAEKNLRESEERTSKLISLMPAAVYTCDIEGRLTYFNQQAVEMWGREPKLGYDQDRYCGSFRMWTPEGELLKHEDCPMADAVHEGRMARNEEVVIEQPSGARIVVNVNIDPLYNQEGKLIGAINVFVDITKRKKAEQALRESEERLRLATRAANIFSWAYDVKAGVYSFSDNAAAILGISRLPRTSEDTDGLVHPDDSQLIQQQLQTAIAEATGFSIDFRSVKDNGTIVWLSVQTTMLTDKEGNASQLLGIAQDISERKDAESALQKSESRFRTLADAVPQIIWTNEPHGKATFFNQRWYEYSGLSYEQSFGKGWQAIVHPDDAPASTDKWNTALAKGEIFDTEYRLRNRNGDYCWFVGRNVPLKNESEHVIGWFGSATDVDDLKNAEEALRQSKGRLQLIIESARGFAIFTTTVDDIVDSWSPGAAEIFGWREEEIIGQNASVLFTSQDREKNQPGRELEQAAVEGMAPNVRWHLHKDGSLIFINGAVHPAYNAEGILSGYVKIGRDMTAQHHAETALRQAEEVYRNTLEKEVEQRTTELKESNNSLRYANENLRQFATIASHDLQEPLRKLRMFAAVLQRFKNELPEEGKEVLSKIRTTSDRMSLLIREVLQYSKIAYGIKEFVTTDLDAILKNVQGDLELLLTDTEATIIYDDALPQIDAIPLQINQLFYNLLTNALKFRREDLKPRIHIWTSPVAVDDVSSYAALHQNKAYVAIHLSDNGIGFDQQFAEQIFQIFERLHSVDEFEGTGVGLALCKKIVENHNGHIFATSKKGEGALFTIILPVKQ